MKTALFLLVLLISQLSVAQNYALDFSYLHGMPKGSFARNVEDPMPGADISLMYRVSKSVPVFLGAGISYQNYGLQKYSEYHTRESRMMFDSARPMKIRNNVIVPYVITRFRLPTRKVQPFVDMIAGFSHIYTTSLLKDARSLPEILDGEPRDRINNTSDIVLSAGVGGGLSFPIIYGEGEHGQPLVLSLLIKGRYLLGGNVEYLRESDTVFHTDYIEYQFNRSRLDVVGLNVGLQYSF